MSMNFPSPAVPGQIYASPGGPVYRFDDPIWSPVPAPGSIGTETRRATVSPFDFGGIGDGVADDTFAIQQAIDFLYTSFVGGEVDMSGGRWLVDSADIVMKTGVTLKGTWRSNGELINADYPAGPVHVWAVLRSTIVLNPLYTIRMNDDACGIEGLAIFPKNLMLVGGATPLRNFIDTIKTWTGKAITIGSGVSHQGAESYVGYCFIVGFQYAIHSSQAGRVKIEWVSGDCLNGVYMDNSLDMQHLSHCHFWTFYGRGPVTSYAVSGAANNGSGLVRLTVPANVMVTGDIVTVNAVGGTTEANGRWVATVIDATHIDLQGSTFANAWTSGGTVYLSTYSLFGIAYDFANVVDWAQADTCFSYGWNIGFHIANSNDTELLNCGADGPVGNTKDPTLTGYRLDTVGRAKLIGCKAAGQSTGLIVNAGAPAGTEGTAIVIGSAFWGLLTVGISVLTGHATITSCEFFNTPVGVAIDPASGGVTAIGNKSAQTGIIAVTGSGAGLRKSTLMNNAWKDTSIGERELIQPFSFRLRTMGEYTTSVSGVTLDYQKSNGSPDVPTATAVNDFAINMRAAFYDGVNAFRVGAAYRMAAFGNTSDTSSPGGHVWAATAAGSTTVADRMALSDAALYSSSHLGLTLGTSTSWWSKASVGHLGIADGMTAPATVAGQALIYVDSADGDLKVKFGDGTVKTIVVDT